MTEHLRAAAVAAAILLLASCGGEGPKDGPQTARPDGVVGALENLDALDVVDPDAPGGNPHRHPAILDAEASKIIFRKPEPKPDVMGEEWDLAKDADVYVVGACNRLFKNGVSYGLGHPELRFGYSVFVSGGDVYVAGDTHPSIGGYKPGVFLWKNGAVVPLDGTDDSSVQGSANQIAVSGEDVYVAGYLEPRAALWANGELQYLGGDSGEAWCVALSGGDVYAGGQDFSQDKTGAIWKNGVKQTVRPVGGSSAKVHSLFVSGDDVYAAVTDMRSSKFRPLLWKNGEIQELPNDGELGAKALAVFVEGGDVYVAGNEWGGNYSTVPVLWKNGVQQKIWAGNGAARAESLFVSGGNVYIAGSIVMTSTSAGIPTLWINGEAVDLRPSGFTHQAWSVFVVPKEVAPKNKEKVEPAAGDHGRPVPRASTRKARP